jgi:hypothetical protein
VLRSSSGESTFLAGCAGRDKGWYNVAALDQDAIAARRAERCRWWTRAATVLLLAGQITACSPRVAKLTNPGSPRCQETLRDAFESILLDQQEPPDQAAALGDSAARALAQVDLGASAFRLPSQTTGVSYAFAFERDDANRCLLHLVAWQKGTLQYGNNVQYLETRSLPGCGCVQ